MTAKRSPLAGAATKRAADEMAEASRRAGSSQACAGSRASGAGP